MSGRMHRLSVTEHIREQARNMAEGEILSAKALLHLGSRASIAIKPCRV